MGWEWVNDDRNHSQIIPHPELLNEPLQKENNNNLNCFQLPGGVFSMTLNCKHLLNSPPDGRERKHQKGRS